MVTLFDWDEANVGHIANHGIEPFEAEEAVNDASAVSFDAHDKGISGVIGRTEEGRLVVVIYIVRNGLYRVITARNASDAEKKIYRRRL